MSAVPFGQRGAASYALLEAGRAAGRGADRGQEAGRSVRGGAAAAKAQAGSSSSSSKQANIAARSPRIPPRRAAIDHQKEARQSSLGPHKQRGSTDEATCSTLTS